MLVPGALLTEFKINGLSWLGWNGRGEFCLVCKFSQRGAAVQRRHNVRRPHAVKLLCMHALLYNLLLMNDVRAAH